MPNKINGRLEKPTKTNAAIKEKGKRFICIECSKIQYIKNVEFGTHYICADCGGELQEKIL